MSLLDYIPTYAWRNPQFSSLPRDEDLIPQTTDKSPSPPSTAFFTVHTSTPFAPTPIAASIRELTKEDPPPPSPFAIAAAYDLPCPGPLCQEPKPEAVEYKPLPPHVEAAHLAQLERNAIAPAITVALTINPTRNALQILTTDPKVQNLLRTLQPGFTVELPW